jgi:hypothetical protein
LAGGGGWPVEQWVGAAKVNSSLIKALGHSDPLVRAVAVRAAEPLLDLPGSAADAALRQLLDDPVRSVRLSAAWALRAELKTNSLAATELKHFLDLSADQPTGQMQKGIYHYSRGEMDSALSHSQRRWPGTRTRHRSGTSWQ